MKFTILINPTHDWQTSINHALQLAQSMTQQKHQLLAVFFFGEAVKISTVPEFQNLWQKLQQLQSIKLMLCRTMIENHEIDPTLCSGFQVVGMGQLTKAMELADKTIEIT